ncbi:hypothetical protein CYMTET_7048 [Cymbomonas tetramitiformis]|uniref:Uncharacterized protein n=1 Tax=Cymbomonas tetramitiformis TaxID=36881 RepID=A0AAE0LH96_9CHLO|nr:hypothetical protein CYMTET_7048 [Cymbomonas tetramitiformis]
MMKATPEDKKAFKKDSKPDWQGVYEELSSFLQSTGSESGTPSETYSWLYMEPVEENGKMASRKAMDEDADGDVSDEYLHNENLLVGLTGSDGLESAMLLSSTKDTVTSDMRRRAIDECVSSLLMITLFRNRVTENLRAQFPAGKGDVEWKDLEDIVRVRDKIKDEVEDYWSLSIVQD